MSETSREKLERWCEVNTLGITAPIREAIRAVLAENAEAKLTMCDKCGRKYPLVMMAIELEDGGPLGNWCCICHDMKALAHFKAERDALRAEVERLREALRATIAEARGEVLRERKRREDAELDFEREHSRTEKAEAALLDAQQQEAQDIEALGKLEAERDALRERLEIEPVDLDMVEELRTLRAEVSKMRTATAQAARRVFAPTDEIGDARAEAADHAAVARGRLDTIAEVEARAEKAEAALGGAYTALCALEPLLTTKEQVAHFLRALAFCKYDKHPEWDERVAALRDTTPRVCGCPDCTAPAEPPREEE